MWRFPARRGLIEIRTVADRQNRPINTYSFSSQGNGCISIPTFPLQIGNNVLARRRRVRVIARALPKPQ